MSVLADFWLGIRLAVGGGRITRTAAIRLVLTAVGIGLATAILLAAASMGHARAASQGREQAQAPVHHTVAGVDPLYTTVWATQVDDGTSIRGRFVYASGPDAPVPPGLDRLPEPGQMIVSPALHRLLDSPDGRYLRARFPYRVVGEIAKPGLAQPDERTFWIGARQDLAAHAGRPVYGFGGSAGSTPLQPVLVALLAVGATVLLVPVLAFVVTVSRIAGAERDRRLSALRLAGCGATQVRRIAAAEALVGTGFGMLLGAGLFVLARSFATGVSLLGFSFFPSDLTPPWPLAVLVGILVPVLAVAAALFAQRRTVVEPLGVFRETTPIRRRVWWRVAVLAAGVAALAGAGVLDRGSDLWSLLLVVGTLGLLTGVAVVLPWLVERAVGALRGGRPSWQLAIRRLQLDSGTASRVVAGLAVVLAGAVAVQSMLAVLTSPDYTAGSRPRSRGVHKVQTFAPAADVADRVARVPGVSATHEVHYTSGRLRGAPDGAGYVSVTIAGCDTVTWMFAVSSCHDGQVFHNTGSLTHGGAPGKLAGRELGLRDYVHGTSHAVGSYRVPGDLVPTRPRPRFRGADIQLSALVVTPGAAREPLLRHSAATVLAEFDATDPAVRHAVYDALASYGWRTSMYLPGVGATAPGVQGVREQRVGQIRSALLAGSLFVLLLAGASLLVLASEQVRERGRSLAALAASGVPRTVLARSLLWQNLIPVLVGTAAACAGGAALGALVLAVSGVAVAIDGTGMAVFAGAAVVLVVLVTLASLPLLRGVTRVESLRTE